MLKRQRGQALVLVLILLVVGALLVTPALNLAFTGLKSRMIHHTDLMEQYAADGAQEYSLWRLTDTGFTATLTVGEEYSNYIVLNGVRAEYTIAVQAAPGAPSDAPAMGDMPKFKVTKTVSPPSAPIGVETTFTYTITLQYMYQDVTLETLTVIQDNLASADFEYVPGSTEGNITTGGDSIPIDDQYLKILGGGRLKWTFDPIYFSYWEERWLSFQVTATLSQGTYCNQVYIPPGTYTPFTASIIVGSPGCTTCPELTVSKEVKPQVAFTGVPTPFTYTISIKNNGCVAADIANIKDALPAGLTPWLIETGGVVDGTVFDAFGNPPFDPQKQEEDINGRYHLDWAFSPAVELYAGETLTLSFQAVGALGDSGTYANEVHIVVLAGVFDNTYSWPTSGIVVPQYDISSTAGGTTIKLVAVVSGGGHKIKSWQVE